MQLTLQILCLMIYPEPSRMNTKLFLPVQLQNARKYGKTLIFFQSVLTTKFFEAYHKTGCATDGDWESVMKQFLRCGLAFTF